LGARVGPFFGNYFGQTFYIQGLNIGYVGYSRIGHNRGGVGVYQNNFITQFAKGFAGLGARVIKLTSLSNNDWPRPDYEDFVDVTSLWHIIPPILLTKSLLIIKMNVLKQLF
jgi:hypothetical protein